MDTTPQEPAAQEAVIQPQIDFIQQEHPWLEGFYISPENLYGSNREPAFYPGYGEF